MRRDRLLSDPFDFSNDVGRAQPGEKDQWHHRAGRRQQSEREERHVAAARQKGRGRREHRGAETQHGREVREDQMQVREIHSTLITIFMLP